MKLRTLGLVFCVAAALNAAKKPVTVDAASGAPRPGLRRALTWAPDGKRFAWMERGKLLVYDIPAKTQRELLSTEAMEAAAIASPQPERFDWQNRRVAENSFAWSDSGGEILLSMKGDLFLWHSGSNKWEQLTATPVAERDAKLSPDGKRVAFRREHDLYSLEIATKNVTRLTHDGSDTLLNGETDWVYPEELDLGTAYWWSPDSQHIAYMQFDVSREFIYPQVDLRGLRAVYEPERYPHAGTPNADVRLGVVAATGGDTCWLDLGETRGHLLARVYWTPDSKRLAVMRLNRVQNELDFALAGASGETPRTILHEQDKYWINVTGQFRFVGNDSFLWSSERDGFRHLYLYSMDGKERRRITQGSWEVTELAGFDEKRGLVYYVSTEASPLERQLYSAALDGSGRKRISEGAGTHSISMSPTTEYYVDTFSSLANPPARTVHTSDGKQWAVYREADRKPLDEYDILPTEILQVKARDGVTLYGRLIKPAGFEPGRKYPAVVMVYGGPHAQSVRNDWAGLSWDQVLAHKGFVIWQLDNRGSAGRGHAFEAPLYRRFGRAELADQREGVQWLIRQGFVDPERIGISGWSYGGYMTLYSMLNAPELFKVGVAGAPVTSWTNYDTIYTERYLGLPSENADGYKQGSAVTYAGQLAGKLLIIHNIEDDNVLFQNTLQMAEALEKAGKVFSMITFPQKAHGVTGPLRKDLMEAETQFFEKHLK